MRKRLKSSERLAFMYEEARGTYFEKCPFPLTKAVSGFSVAYYGVAGDPFNALLHFPEKVMAAA